MRNIAPVGFLSCFLLFWSAITLAFDGLMLWAIYGQVRATGYAQVPGTITHSEVEVHQGDGTTYAVDVKYEYRVGSETFVGDTYRYGAMSSNDDYARRVVAELPVGQQVPVYYDPYDPADSVLLPGVQGSDLFMLLFMTAFNAVMLLGWSYAFSIVRRRIKGLPAAGVPIIRRGPRLHVRLNTVGPFGALCGTAAILAFIAVFPIAFLVGMHPPLPLIAGVWLLILGLSVAAAAYHGLRLQSGQSDLILNEMNQTLLLPRTFGRKQDVYVPFDAVQGLEVETRVDNSGEGTTHHHAPVLVFTDGDGDLRREKVAEWTSRGDAEEFTAWLRERVGVDDLDDTVPQ